MSDKPCFKGPSLPRAASFSAIRNAHFHSRKLFEVATLSNVPDDYTEVSKLTKALFFELGLDGRQVIQETLAHRFGYKGPIDGEWGPKSGEAIVKMFEWYRANGNNTLPHDRNGIVEAIMMARNHPN